MKKQHQHFIPKTYLKKFAHTQKGDTYFVDAYNKLTSKSMHYMSIVNICFETDLYTLKHLEGDKKYNIENFFSDNIESRYPDVFRLLVQEKKEIITAEEKTFILYTTLSMYFRTPKVLNQFVAFSNTLIEQVISESNSDTIDFLGYKISIKEKSFNDIKKEIKERKRIDYIKTQLALLDEFVKFKAFDGLVIIELVGEQEFITSDNPVEIRNSLGTGFNLFDARNSIYIPLDPKHALFIVPGQEEAIINQVFYRRDSLFSHITLNHCVFENAERWILGTRRGIAKFFIDKEEYAKPAHDDNPIVKKMKISLELMQTLTMLAEKGVTNDNQDLIEFMKNLRQHELFNEFIDWQDTYNKMKEMGLKI